MHPVLHAVSRMQFKGEVPHCQAEAKTSVTAKNPRLDSLWTTFPSVACILAQTKCYNRHRHQHMLKLRYVSSSGALQYYYHVYTEMSIICLLAEHWITRCMTRNAEQSSCNTRSCTYKVGPTGIILRRIEPRKAVTYTGVPGGLDKTSGECPLC